MTVEAKLRAGAAELGLILTGEQVKRLLDYLSLIQKWNQVYNLTAVRNPDDMLAQHLLDSLAVVVPLRRQCPGAARILDVGSGAGLPGVVLAICGADWQVDCVDTVGKKAAFIQQVGAQLGLANLRGVHARVENLSGPYDVIASRAFASLPDFVSWSSAALAPEGVWMAMKGRHPEAELAALPADVAVFHVEPLAVPGLDAERCIVWMRRASKP